MMPLIATTTLLHAVMAATLGVAAGICAFYHLGRR